jgi:hypothetical protein
VSGRSIPALLVALLLGGTTGCSAGSAGEPATSPSPKAHRTIVVPAPEPLPRGVHLSFIQQRFDEGSERAQVRVVNGTQRPLHVRSVGVDWAGYPLRLHRVDYDVPGQLTVDLRYVLPRADCSRSAGAAAIHAVAVTRNRTIRQPMAADGARFLHRLWRTECNARKLQRVAAVRYADRWTVEGTGQQSVLHGFIDLRRREGTDDVSVDQVQGSVLFEMDLRGETTMAGDEDRAAVPVDFRYGRCDEHARSQSTQTFVFRIWLRLGDGEPLAQVVQPTNAQQTRLLRFLDFACGGITRH